MLRRALQLVFTLVVLVMIAVVGLLYYLRNHGLTVEFTQTQVQAQVETYFPMTHQLPQGVVVELSNPLVLFDQESNRVQYSMDATARLAPLPTRFDGSVELSGILRYQPMTQEFYLDDARIEALNFRGLPPQLRPRIEEVADQLARTHLHDRPLFALDGPLFPQEGWMAFLPPVELRSVTVERGKIRVHATLGL